MYIYNVKKLSSYFNLYRHNIFIRRYHRIPDLVNIGTIFSLGDILIGKKFMILRIRESPFNNINVFWNHDDFDLKWIIFVEAVGH